MATRTEPQRICPSINQHICIVHKDNRLQLVLRYKSEGLEKALVLGTTRALTDDTETRFESHARKIAEVLRLPFSDVLEAYDEQVGAEV